MEEIQQLFSFSLMSQGVRFSIRKFDCLTLSLLGKQIADEVSKVF